MTFRGQSFSKFMARSAARCMAAPWTTAGVAIATLALASLGATQLAVDPSPEAYLKDTPEWAFYETIDREYEIGETLVIGLQEPGGTVFDVETVTAVAELDRVLSAMPEVERVLSIASATALAKNGNSLDLAPLLPSDPISREHTLRLGERIRSHPLYSQLLVDARHEVTFVFVQLSAAHADPVVRLSTVRRIFAEADRFQSRHRSIHLAGSPVTKEAIATGVQHDTLLFFPAALALLTVLMWMMFGDPFASLVPLGVVGYSSIVVVGVLALMGVPVNMATSTVPTIILVVGLADSVHFMSELRRQYARTGDREASLIATVEAIALPCLLTTATSAVGFMALISSRVGPLREFGYATAIGLVVAYFASMLLTPVALSRFGYPRSRTHLFPAAPRLGHWMSQLAMLGNKHLVITIAGSGLLFGGCVAAVMRLNIDSDFIRYLDDGHRLRQDIAVIERTLGGADVIEVILDGDQPDKFQTPEGLAVLDRLGRDLRQIDGVSRVVSLADYMRLANAVMEGSETEHELPATTGAIAQLGLLDPTAFSALINDDGSQARMSLQIRSMSSNEVLELTEIARQTAVLSLKDSGVSATFTGLPPLFAKIVRNLVEDAAGSFGIAGALIFLAMFLGLRSPAMAAAALIPNVLTVGLTFGTMALLGLNFDTNSAFVACLGIGIAVDDTIHIAARYQRAREEGSPSPAAAVRYAITHAGHPVVLTSLLLVVGFSVLCLSTFKPTFRVGLLSAILVFYAVLLDLGLLPTLLVTADRLERRYTDPERDAAEVPSAARQTLSMLTKQ